MAQTSMLRLTTPEPDLGSGAHGRGRARWAAPRLMARAPSRPPGRLARTATTDPRGGRSMCEPRPSGRSPALRAPEALSRSGPRKKDKTPNTSI